MPAAPFTPPPIPIHLAQFPTLGGLVIPWITLQHRNGKAALGLVDSNRQQLCLHERRCGVCGGVIEGRMIFLMREVDLVRKCSHEPPLCPPCAAYSQKACPMVSGYMKHYRESILSVAPFVTRRCGDPACLCWAWLEPEQSIRQGVPAEKWYALWTRQYRITHDEQGRVVAGFSGQHMLALREVRPGTADQPVAPSSDL